MGYNKFIVSGTQFELYQYARHRIQLGKRPKRYENQSHYDDVVDARKNDENGQKIGKRQDNLKRAVMAFRRLILCNLRGSQSPLFITFTYAENITDLRRAYKDFNGFVKALRYKYGSLFRYIAIPEFQKRGAIHFHALFWDLPESHSICSQERDSRTIARIWGHGFVDLFESDGSEKLSGYLSKYLTKAMNDPNLRHFKAYTGSRNLLRPIEGRGFDSVHLVLSAWGLSTVEPVHIKTFSTYWLGEGRYSIYKITE